MEPLDDSQALTAIKKRGRPKGSKNKAKCSNNRLISAIKCQRFKVTKKRVYPRVAKPEKKRRSNLFRIILVIGLLVVQQVYNSVVIHLSG